MSSNYYALKWILNLAETTSRLARWRLKLFAFETDVARLAAVRHETVDIFLRLGTIGEDRSHLEDDILLYAIDAYNTISIAKVACAKNITGF